MEEKKSKLIYEDLSYQIIGSLFEVYNEIGGCHKEIVYQRALALMFKKNGLKFKEQVYQPIEFSNAKIGSYYLDFLIEEKVVLEIKRKIRFSHVDYEQIKKYLKTTGLKLGLLASFSDNAVKFARVLNLY
jgi:GxxExxY protein